MWRKFRGQRGEVNSSIALVVVVFVIAIFVVATIPILGALTNDVARTNLESSGYVVLGAGEYDDLITLLNLNNAAAVTAASTSEDILDKLLLFNENEAFLFSDNVHRTVQLVAGTPSDNFCAWTEVTDNAGTTLSSKFTTTAGYIREVTLYAYGTGDKLCILELAYGPDVGDLTTIGRCFVRSDFTWILNIYSKQIPAGQKVYSRFKSELAGQTY